jgi:hypothetical protein
MWALIRGPIASRQASYELSACQAAGYRFVGITSYFTFPGAEHRDERDYATLCEAWFHCFQNPDRYLPSDRPRILLAESDFTNPLVVNPAHYLRARKPQPPADVVYITDTAPWKQEAAKGWSLAAQCAQRLAKAGFDVLVIGAAADDVFPEGDGVRFAPVMLWPQLLALLVRSRVLLAPNICDPCPRVLAEALCLNVPLVVHRHILGGWAYVNRFTGAFFDDEGDVVGAVREVLDAATQPRAWFRAHHGPARAGQAMATVLRQLQGGSAPEHVTLEPLRLPIRRVL